LKQDKDFTKDPIVFQADAMPFDFRSSAKMIAAMSNKIAEGPRALLTGPSLIKCTEPDTKSCTTIQESLMQQYHAVPDADNTLTLTGEHQVYNYFTIDIKDWFYPTNEFMTPSTLLVEAEGFVFATVIDTVEITAPTTKDKVTVTRDWNTSPSFQCNIDSKKFSRENAYKEMPKVSNKVVSESASADSSDMFYNLRKMVTKGKAQDPSTHLLVNFVTTIHHVTSAFTYNKTASEWCTGLHYKLQAKGHESNVTKATYLLPNVASGLEMWEYSWEGGQLISAGASVHLHEVEMKQGLYIADEAYFCGVVELVT
jgi:hypothetical protein